jgi:hypothetical protein
MKWLSYLFIFGLSVENILKGVVGVQTFSLAISLIPIICLYNFRSLNLIKPTLIFISALFFYGITVYLLTYKKYGLYSPLLRQMLSFIAGGGLYLSSSLIIKEYKFSKLSSTILKCSIPILFLGIIQKITGFGYVAQDRVSALFSEPSHYGDYLVLLIAPFLIFELTNIKKRKNNYRIIVSIIFLLWGLNLIFVQSGTAILKMGSLIVLMFFIYPKFLKQKLMLLFFGSSLTIIASFVENSYVSNLIKIGFEILKSPDYFMKSHNFYDRFYPTYGVLKFIAESKNIFGYGFGADYFEWKNIFLPSQYEAQIIMKPYGSFLNSNFSKVFLYFGILGLAWIVYLLKIGLKSKSPILKISFLNIFLACFWGVASFAQPYLWFWLAIIENYGKDSGESLGE